MLRRLIIVSLLPLPALVAAIHGIDSVGITVSDLDRAVDFYTRVLTFEKVSETQGLGSAYEHLEGLFGLRFRTARLRLGSEFLELTEYMTPKGRPAPPDGRSNDRWFQHIAIIVSDMDQAYERLHEFKVQYVSPAPQRLPDWNRNAGGIRAFYFKDPDSHSLEILQFPDGKGNPRWHARTDRLFLGIDHTAIVISDTRASLEFYRDLLGLVVVGESENYGPEQERLNSVFGAHLRITALRGAAGPGVELLEYLAPRDGRPYPTDEKANDLIHWRTRLVSSSVAETAVAIAKGHLVLVSSGVIDLAAERATFRKSLMVRDPDGHALEIAEP
jgi:catechol 2,3-dioxygenase-like lactoylglutathione lyase family enzyme